MANLNMIGKPEDLYIEGNIAVRNYLGKVITYYKLNGDGSKFRVTVANGVVIEDTVEECDFKITSVAKFFTYVGARVMDLHLTTELGYKIIRSVSIADYLEMVK